MAAVNPEPAHSTPVKWYHRTAGIIGAFLCVGPLALPLVWMNPRYDTMKKIVWTLVMLAVSYALWIFMKDSYDRIMQQYADLKAAMGG